MKKIAVGLLIIIAFSSVTVLGDELNIKEVNNIIEIKKGNIKDEEEKKKVVESDKEEQLSDKTEEEKKGERRSEKESKVNKIEKDVKSYDKNDKFFGEVYEVKDKKVNYSKAKNYTDENGIYREEFKNDAEGLESLTYLIKKTTNKYEVALARNDGTFNYIKSFDNYENSVDFINLDKNIEGNLVIIDEDGAVVYAEESIGRIIKHIGGVPQQGYSQITSIYTTSSLKEEHTYINHGYIDDVPIISDIGKAAKIMVSGYTGWVSKNRDAKEYDLIVIPLNHVVNPSHYIVENGELQHFISSDVKVLGKGHKIKVGKAPKFLKSNTKYYSYDGKYFYESLEKLIRDLKVESTDKSLNKSNPYYAYYLNLPFRSKTNHTVEDINKYIEKNTVQSSKLRNTGKDFIDAQNIYGVNALLALGVAINESGWGTSSIAKEKNNLFGLRATDINPGQDAHAFETVRDSIFNFAKGYISEGYTNAKDWRYYGSHLGNKNLGINVKYASDPFWGEKANSHIYIADYNMNLKDYNYYQLGVYNDIVSVKNINGKTLYKSKVETPVIIIDKNGNYNLNGESVYRLYSDRPIEETKPFNGEYIWNNNGYARKGSIDIINQGSYNVIFKDVLEGFWAKEQIEKLHDLGHIVGYADGTFRPNNEITRAEFIKLVNNHFGYKEQVSQVNFTDVNRSDWFYNDIKKALEIGYIDKNNKKFRPNDSITREEVAAIITTIKKNKDNNLDKLDKYIDKNKVSQWAKSSVEGAIENGYMGKTQDNKFRPNDKMTRAEAVVTIDRIK